MRSEDAIRRHLADLRWAWSQPCACSDPSHPQHAECVQGGLLMTATIKALEWALGDNDDMGRAVEHYAQARAKAEGRA